MTRWLDDVSRDVRRAIAAKRVVPRFLEFHPGTSCPLKCGFCHTARNFDSIYAEKTNRDTLTTLEIFDILTDFRARGGEQLVLSGGLEPFTSNIVFDVLEHARDIGLNTSVYTCGIGKYLTEQTLPRVLRSAKWMRFSISAVTADTYGKIQAPEMNAPSAKKAFQHATFIARAALRLRASMSRKARTIVGTQYLVCDENAAECMEAAIVWAKEGADFIDLRLDIVPERRPNRDLIESIRTQIDDVNARFSETKVELRELSEFGLPSACSCQFWKSSVVIDAWGGVHVCCVVADRDAATPPFGLGFVRSGSAFTRLLDSLQLQPAIEPYCVHCSDRARAFNCIFLE